MVSVTTDELPPIKINMELIKWMEGWMGSLLSMGVDGPIITKIQISECHYGSPSNHFDSIAELERFVGEFTEHQRPKFLKLTFGIRGNRKIHYGLYERYIDIQVKRDSTILTVESQDLFWTNRIVKSIKTNLEAIKRPYVPKMVRLAAMCSAFMPVGLVVGQFTGGSVMTEFLAGLMIGGMGTLIASMIAPLFADYLSGKTILDLRDAEAPDLTVLNMIHQAHGAKVVDMPRRAK